MTPTNERKTGGLIALTVEEVESILGWSEWTRQRRSLGLYADEKELVARLTEWKRRHVPEDAA